MRTALVQQRLAVPLRYIREAAASASEVVAFFLGCGCCVSLRVQFKHEDATWLSCSPQQDGEQNNILSCAPPHPLHARAFSFILYSWQLWSSVENTRIRDGKFSAPSPNPWVRCSTLPVGSVLDRRTQVESADSVQAHDWACTRCCSLRGRNRFAVVVPCKSGGDGLSLHGCGKPASGFDAPSQWCVFK